jgi:putative Holliday junction resolvase
MRVLAVDPGTVRCGLAVSDSLGMLATPLEVLQVGDGRDLASRIAARALELEAGCILVGHPLNMDGSTGPRAEAAARLADEIRGLGSVEVILVDERLSSYEAEERLKDAGVRVHPRRGRDGRKHRDKGGRAIDAVAAAVFLQWWLDRQRV